MKKSLRFASAALALTLAAGMTLPAFAAAKADYSKDETVYAVMNADGSIKSTTVSEHLYSASGLSNVTDESTLTDIQNTESDAAFTTTSTFPSVMLTTGSTKPFAFKSVSAAFSFSEISVIPMRFWIAVCFSSSEIWSLLMICINVSLFFARICSLPS